MPGCSGGLERLRALLGKSVPLELISAVDRAKVKKVLTTGPPNQAATLVTIYANSSYLPRGSKFSLTCAEVAANLDVH